MAGKVTINTVIKLGSSGSESTLVDYASKFADFDFPREQDLKDITPFGVSFKQFAPGLQTGTFKGNVFWDTTIDGILNGMFGDLTAINFEYGPDGSTTGNPKYTGSLFIKSLGNPVKVGDTKMMPCEFQITGTITRTTY
ncbi:MAG: hypothetical protein JO053_07135 [Acidobacteria bacterium]|nr:hypothetical protein [Acidobacteriota bacterium]